MRSLEAPTFDALAEVARIHDDEAIAELPFRAVWILVAYNRLGFILIRPLQRGTVCAVITVQNSLAFVGVTNICDVFTLRDKSRLQGAPAPVRHVH